MKIKIFLIFLFMMFMSPIIAQPYLYFSVQFSDTLYGEEHLFEKLQRYNISNYSEENFPPQGFTDENIRGLWDPSQSYLAIDFNNKGYLIYDCGDTSNYFVLDESAIIDELLYSPQRNKLYIFSDDYGKIKVLNLSTQQIVSTLLAPQHNEFNSLMYPYRNSFFSSDSNYIYFYNVDTLTNTDQVWTYSLETNTIIDTSDLFSLGGHSGSDGYSLTFGRNGKGIIGSYPFYNNPVKDFYYNFYDFDSDSGSPFIYHNGFSEAYFNGNGEFLLILETNKDTSDVYYHTGLVKIYVTESGQLTKTFNVPAGGTIYTFDNYLNDIYYIRNLDSIPEIYNLTQLKLNSISLGLTFTPSGLNFPYGFPEFAVEATGEFFTDSSVIYFNGEAKTTTFISDIMVTFQLDSSDIPVADNYPVWASNYGSSSDTLFFVVADSLPEAVTPVLDCISDGLGGYYIASLGYNNNNNTSVYIPYGNKNMFTICYSLEDINRGQPTIFLPGEQINVFTLSFDVNTYHPCSDYYRWTLDREFVDANNIRAKPCGEE